MEIRISFFGTVLGGLDAIRGQIAENVGMRQPQMRN